MEVDARAGFVSRHDSALSLGPRAAATAGSPCCVEEARSDEGEGRDAKRSQAEGLRASAHQDESDGVLTVA